MGPMTGYEMRQMMERSTANFWTESFGQIYPALKRMVKDGLATVEEQSKDGRAKKVYRITGEGERRLRRWLGVETRPQVRRNELLLKVFFGDQALRGDVAVQVVAERQRCEEELWPAYFAKLEAIIAMPARTPEGLRAKAGVLRVALAATIGAQNDAARAVQWEPHERLAWSLVQDLTAER